ncbi:MAG: ABC transporter substrate binding protein [Pseudomonadales bacterium]
MLKVFNYILNCAVCWLVLLVPVAYAKTDVVLLLSSDSKPYQEVVAGIRSALSPKSQQYNVTITTLDGLQKGEQTLPATYGVLVTIGTRATRYALDEKISKTIFATFVTRSSLMPELSVDEKFPGALKGAMVLDQPAQRIVALAQLIKPKMRSLGTVVNGSSANRKDEFSLAAVTAGLQLNVATLFEDSNPIGDLKSIFSSSDVFIVVPDKARFNSKIAKWILFLSYRHRVPVIGYSQKYSDAGALVSLFSTPEQMGRDTGRLIREGLSDRRRLFSNPRVLTPQEFTLTVNDKVATSLGLEIDSAEQLKQQLLGILQLNTEKKSVDDVLLPLRTD